ncbi:MAG: peptidylprolyl isomerase [Kiritimatiellae bacterium]|nr:peptidylprolyl isomerase [Kiritimatiellia bacterium]
MTMAMRNLLLVAAFAAVSSVLPRFVAAQQQAPAKPASAAQAAKEDTDRPKEKGILLDMDIKETHGITNPSRRRKRKQEEEVALPDLKPGDAAVTVEGETLTWGALLEMATLHVKRMRLPPSIGELSEEDRQSMMTQLTMRRVYELAGRFAAKAMLAHEAKRRGAKLIPETVESMERQVFNKLTLNKADAMIAAYKKPDSFFSHEFTNSLYILAFRDQIVRPSIKVTDEDVKKAMARVNATNALYVVENESERQSMLRHREKIAKGEEDFAVVADQISNCDSSLYGGVWGTFSKEKLHAKLWEAAVALPLNELSQVVETEYSFHILKVTAKQYPVGTKEGAEGVEPVSVTISHIERDKKEPIPVISAEETRKKLIEVRTKVEMAKRERKLRETVKIESPLKIDLSMKKKSAQKSKIVPITPGEPSLPLNLK